MFHCSNLFFSYFYASCFSCNCTACSCSTSRWFTGEGGSVLRWSPSRLLVQGHMVLRAIMSWRVAALRLAARVTGMRERTPGFSWLLTLKHLGFTTWCFLAVCRWGKPPFGLMGQFSAPPAEGRGGGGGGGSGPFL